MPRYVLRDGSGVLRNSSGIILVDLPDSVSIAGGDADWASWMGYGTQSPNRTTNRPKYPVPFGYLYNSGTSWCYCVSYLDLLLMSGVLKWQLSVTIAHQKTSPSSWGSVVWVGHKTGGGPTGAYNQTSCNVSGSLNTYPSYGVVS